MTPRTVQIAHGMGEHIGRYLALIEVSASHDFVVYGNDHRGHGLTTTSAANPSQQYLLDHSREIDAVLIS